MTPVRNMRSRAGSLLDRNVSNEYHPMLLREFLAHLLLIVLGFVIIFGLLVLRTEGM